MASPRDIRRCALQAMYQFDAAGDEDRPGVRHSLAQSPGGTLAHEDGFNLACAAWEQHQEADAAITPLTPEWPIHRQPVIDRCILRLAYHEMYSGRTAPKIAINEAVELAKEFSTEKSPMFINGVLDKLFRDMKEKDQLTSEEAVESPPPPPPVVEMESETEKIPEPIDEVVLPDPQ